MKQLKEVPVHVHCIANYRVSAFFYRYRRDVLGMDATKALAEMEAIWHPEGVWMAMSLVASTRGLALMPAYAKNLMPWSVVSRPLEGEAPTIDLAVGYSKANTSPLLKLFLSRVDALIDRVSRKFGDPVDERGGNAH
jgi:DNA-binding transcriptional LysR family regulator